MSETSPYHHPDLRSELVEIARELIRDSGIEGWSMREASRRAGVSQTAPYRHFADKTELVDAVGRSAYADLEMRYRSALERARSPNLEVAVVAKAYLCFAFDEPRLFRLIFSTGRLHDTPEAASSYAVFEGAIARAQDRGDLPSGPPARFAHAVWAAMHGVADLVLSGTFTRRHGERTADRVLASLFRGFHEP